MCFIVVYPLHNWRDTVFLPRRASALPIEWHVFEKDFKARFMDRVSCMTALQEFRSLSMRPKQSVKDFNDLWLQRKLELLQMPREFVSVPDQQALIDNYIAGSNPALSKQMQEHADFMLINDLDYWMEHAITTEAKNTTLKMCLDLARHGTNVQHDAQKKRSQEKPAQSSHAQKAGGSNKKAKKGTAAQYSSPPKTTGKGRAKPGNTVNTDHVEQYADRDLRAPVLSSSKIAELKAAARLSVPSKNASDSTRYPNMEYRLLNKRNCEANNLCYTCFGQIGHDHRAGDCPSSAFKTNVSPPLAAAAIATQSDPSTAKSTPHEGVQQACLAATVQAVPFKNVTMLFVGAVQGHCKGQVTVLLDTGSSHNVCAPGVSKLNSSGTGRSFSVACAGAQHRVKASENMYKLTVQGITTTFAACEMSLPLGVDYCWAKVG